MDLTVLGQPDGKLTPRVGTALVDEHVSRTIHGLECKSGLDLDRYTVLIFDTVLFLNFDKVHVVAVVIPVTGFLPKSAIHDQWCAHLLVPAGMLQVPFELLQLCADDQPAGEVDRHPWRLIKEQEEVEFGTEFPVVAAPELFQIDGYMALLRHRLREE